MERDELKTIDDLLRAPDEGAELIGGEIVCRPMANSEQGVAQTVLSSSSVRSIASRAPAAGGSSLRSVFSPIRISVRSTAGSRFNGPWSTA